MPYCKYIKEKEQRSPDGINWFDTGSYRKGSLIECGLIFCNEHGDDPEILYQWNFTGRTICIENDLYQELVYQYSIDNGLSWLNVEPEQTMTGELIESNSQLCIVDKSNFSGEWIQGASKSQMYCYLDGSTTYKTDLSPYTNADNIFSMEVEEKQKLGYLFRLNPAIKNVFKLPITSKTVELWYLFEGATNLVSVDSSGWDTSNVRYMDSMFAETYAIDTIDLSHLNVDSLERCISMFSFSNASSINISGWKLPNIKYMASMFSYCRNLTTLGFDVEGSPETLNNLFDSCEQLKTITFSPLFSTAKCTSMSSMFGSCYELTSLDLSTFETTKLTNVSYMFNFCRALESLDLSKFDMSNVTSYNMMFNYCNSLTHIKCTQEFRDWCWALASYIALPTQMRDGGSGTWEIVN